MTGRKRTWTDTVKLDRSIRTSQRPGSGRPPASLYRRYQVQRRDIRGFACYSLTPGSGAGPQHILYLHGGAYVHPIESTGRSSGTSPALSASPCTYRSTRWPPGTLPEARRATAQIIDLLRS